MRWKKRSTAPKDGTVIIAAHTDWSGYVAIRWGYHLKDKTKEEWFYLDYSDTAEFDWKYWSHCPQPPKKKNKT